VNCPECTFVVPDALDRCPHCGRPALFPNVRKAEDATEVEAVERRYFEAIARARGRGCETAAKEFEATVATSQAVISRSIEESLRLAKADSEAYATFYELLHAGVRLPDGDHWTRLRGLADWELFGPAQNHIRFAALSADGECLPGYGDVSLQLAESMIAHRATVFEENSAVFFERQRREGHEPPMIAGHRATWGNRGKLGVAKHEAELAPSSMKDQFCRILARAEASGADDVFIEVHVYGNLTRRTLARVIVNKANARLAFVLDLRTRLKKANIEVDER
jgi:hypothetical protein